MWLGNNFIIILFHSIFISILAFIYKQYSISFLISFSSKSFSFKSNSRSSKLSGSYFMASPKNFIFSVYSLKLFLSKFNFK